MAGIIGLRAEDMDQVDALRRAKLDWPQGLPLVRPHVLAPVLVRKGRELVAIPARFGFSTKFASFNARADRLATSPMWRSLFGKSHGIVPLSYVVEWVTKGEEKQPYLIQRKDGKLLLAPALVGAYHDRAGENAFAICTTEPNAFFKHFHDRMIGQCDEELMQRWLFPESREPAALMACIRSPPNDELVAVPTSPEIQKRKSGDWSALPARGEPVTFAMLQARGV